MTGAVWFLQSLDDTPTCRVCGGTATHELRVRYTGGTVSTGVYCARHGHQVVDRLADDTAGGAPC